jgi:predicted ATP-dependent endonuclease of OLD family
MYLSKLLIINYRSCKTVNIDLLKDDPNVYIGINDCGKSSILKGVGLLLDEKPQFNFVKETASKKDFSNSPLSNEEFNLTLDSLNIPRLQYNESETVVIGKFLIENEDKIENNINNFSNQIAWSIECSENVLWIARIFDISKNNFKTLLLVNDQVNPVGGLHAFYLLNDRDLQKKRKEYELSDEIINDNGVGRYSKLEIIRALYNKLGMTLVWADYKYEASFFPKFRYLDWNMSFEEIMKSATDAMSTVIEEYLNPLKITASVQAINAETAINERLQSIRDTIAEIVPVTQLKARVQFNVQEKITDILVNKLTGDGDIHMDLQGDGLKRQIWFALVKASLQAEPKPSDHKRFIWAFDEPETHLYPAAQRKLFDIIKAVTEKNVQSLISTHSTVFIDKSNLKAIKCIHQEANGYTSHFKCTEVDDVFLSLDIRNSDFLFFDKFLVIEGSTEHHLIPALFKMFSGTFLKDCNIQLINLQGASNWTIQRKSLESVLTGFKKSLTDIVYLFDNDQKFLIGEGVLNNNLCFVGKQDIEDSIDNNVWIKIVHEATHKQVQLTYDEVQMIKDQIPSNTQLKSSKEKFLARLENFSKQKLEEVSGSPVTWDLLPSKGEDLAAAILRHIKFSDLIPEEIKSCFKKLLPEVNNITIEAAEPEAA